LNLVNSTLFLLPLANLHYFDYVTEELSKFSKQVTEISESEQKLQKNSLDLP